MEMEMEEKGREGGGSGPRQRSSARRGHMHHPSGLTTSIIHGHVGSVFCLDEVPLTLLLMLLRLIHGMDGGLLIVRGSGGGVLLGISRRLSRSVRRSDSLRRLRGYGLIDGRSERELSVCRRLRSSAGRRV